MLTQMPSTGELCIITTGTLSSESFPHRQSPKFNLQCSLLSCVGGLCDSLSIPPYEFELAAMAAVSYLSTDQPPKLQHLSTQCFQSMIHVDPDTVWLVLQQVATPTMDTPINPPLKPFQFPLNPDSAKYISNIAPLLSLTLRPSSRHEVT